MESGTSNQSRIIARQGDETVVEKREQLRVDRARVLHRIQELAKIGEAAGGGVTRKALTEEDRQGQELIQTWMREAGLMVRRDQAGNLIGRREGTNQSAPAVIIGSHIDTVPNGGNYDGTIGVIGGIEVAQILAEQEIVTTLPLEIIAFCDEEGTRFQGGLFGSRAMVGKVTRRELDAEDEAGISRKQALAAFGLEPELLATAERTSAEIKVFLEMHIEQGPYLQAANVPVGIVTGIAGPCWMTIRLTGEAGHAGTVPMNLRRDPLMASAEIIYALEEIVTKEKDAPTVATVGKVSVFPNGANVIPAHVEFTLDLRDSDLERRTNVLDEIRAKIAEVCRRRMLKYDMKENLAQEPVQCAGHVIESFARASMDSGIRAPQMISGAGHDAMMMSYITDMGMLFVRCKDGISHNVKEYADIADIAEGTSILLNTALHYLND